MDDLRLSLLAIGVLVLIAIYIITARAQKKTSRRQFSLREHPYHDRDGGIQRDVLIEPYDQESDDVEAPEDFTSAGPLYADDHSLQAGAAADIDELANDFDDEPYAAAESDPEPMQRAVAEEMPAEPEDVEVPEMIIVFFLMARDSVFSGADIALAMERYGLLPGTQGIYEYSAEDDQGRDKVLFSVASAVEPGLFDFENMADFNSPGLVAFMQLPGPVDSVDGFDRMVMLIQQMAEFLNAEIHDDKHSVVTLQTLGHLREKIREHELRVQLVKQPHMFNHSRGLS